MNKLEDIFIRLSTFTTTLIATFISTIKICIASKFYLKLPLKTNDTCIILGNGPSLKESLEQNLELIKKYDIVCVNQFAYSEYFEILKPKNYILLDTYYFLYNEQSTDKRATVIASFKKFKMIDWKINFFIPVKGKKSYLVTEILSANKNVSIYYFNYVVTEGFTCFKHFIFRNNLGMPQCQNVLSAALFLNINRNYNEIYLLGADHSWHENFTIQPNNKIMITDFHFYDKDKLKPVSMSDRAEHKLTITSFFLSLYKAFRSYDVIKIYADYRNVKVYNASVKSYIDTFEKKEIN